MKKFAICAMMLLSGCTASMKLPGTRDPGTEQIRLLTEAMVKQNEALIAVLVAKPSPSPTPEVKK